MADTIVNTPGTTTSDSGSGAGFILGAIILVVFAFLVFYYGLPMLRAASTPTNVNVEVPKQVDVNVQPK